MSDSVDTRAEIGLRRIRPYRGCKDSGVGWLGKIPAHWEIHELRRHLFRQPESIKIGPFGSQLKLEFMATQGFKVYGQEHVIARDFMLGQKYVDQSKFAELSACEVMPGDLLVTMMGSTGRCAVVPEEIEPGIMDSHLLRVRLPKGPLDPRFVALVIDESAYVREQIVAAGKGAIMHGLNSMIIKNLVLAVPPVEEQGRILSFADRETAKIDALVAKKERLIELLQEKRTALITRAVTKGLDPNVPMKNSGVEWLDRIPAHWEVKRAKDLSQFVTSGSRGWAAYYADDGSLFLRIGNLRAGAIDLDLTDTQHVRPPAGAEGDRTRVRGGDVLISITALIGAVGLVPEGIAEAFVNQHLALVRPRPRGVDSRWLGYCVLSRVGQEQMSADLYGGTKDGLGLDDIRSLVILLPPHHEQRRIVEILDGGSRKTDSLIIEIRNGIERLKEYRTALISAAVTGKIDVREA